MPGPWGGYREGGGRPKGSKNRSPTIESQAREIAEKAAAAHQTPLEYLVSVYTDVSIPRPERVAAAIAACPYMHVKMGSLIPKQPLQQIYVDTINVVGIESGHYLSDAEVAELAQQSMPLPIENDVAANGALTSPWTVADAPAPPPTGEH